MQKDINERKRGSVAVVGGGVAGMSAACALAGAGWRVKLVERRGYLGGRASSYAHPVGESIDNCQHVLFGCCTNLRGFYERIGVAGKIHWTREMVMIEPGGRRSTLGPGLLPAPLHGMARMIAAHAFTWSDKLALARAMRAMMKADAMVEHGESLAGWLRRHKQTEGAINRFWRLVIASALNAELDEISVPYAAKVIRELFLNSAEAGAMGMSRVPLSELYSPVPEFLHARGGEVLLNTNVEAAEWDNAQARWRVQTRTEGIEVDFLILALPFEATQQLIAKLPRVDGAAALQEKAKSMVHWPICSVHLWFDRNITELDHAVLLDREIHWMYNQSKLRAGSGGRYLELVVSATRSFAALPRQEGIALAIKELAEFFPLVKEAKLEKVALIKEVRATFGVQPGIDALRPEPASPWPNLYLAGDWVQTGWPSTMESAARSGHLAAEALSGGKFLVDDLKPRGLMRLL